ncbi:hypothetical protein EP227_04245 [bacterium]|nr:MAG: hypothetical protein EP227_04245 [bacterium]
MEQLRYHQPNSKNDKRAETIKPNCWEYKKCGREPGGVKTDELGICPSATNILADGLNEGKNGGRICWAIAGTFSNGEKQCTFAKTIPFCTVCDFYITVQKQDDNS